jgi:hypothetical protein
MKRITLLFLAVAFVFAVWVATHAAYVDTIWPKTMGMTMAELEQQIGKPESLRQHTHNGSSYTIWSGPVKTIFLPSGPPTYVFDSAGLLLDWSRDVGDEPAFREKWGL